MYYDEDDGSDSGDSGDFFTKREYNKLMHNYKGRRKNSKNEVWIMNEDDIIRQYFSDNYGNKNKKILKIDLLNLHKLLPNHTINGIKHRWYEEHKKNYDRYKWSEEESNTLIEKYDIYGNNVKVIKLFIETKSSEMIRNKIRYLIKKRILN